MKKVVFFVTFFFFWLAGALSALAEVTVRALGPSVIAVGQNFKVSYEVSITGNEKVSNLKVPEFKDFEVLGGPYKEGSGVNSITINGHTTTMQKTLFSYYLTPKKEGRFTLSSARLDCNGQEILSNALVITVTAADKAAQQQGNTQGGNSAGQQLNLNDEVFVRQIVSKNSVYENEPFVVTVKLYYSIKVNRINEVKYPEYSGFIAQAQDVADSEQRGKEKLNGKVYNTFVLGKYVLIPQKTGQVALGRGTADLMLSVPVRQSVRNPFGGHYTTYANVNKYVGIQDVKIDVKELPVKGKPENFSGGVGSFQMSSSINTDSLRANEAVVVKVKISGTGNVKYVKHPKIVFPNDFEVYDPKVVSKVNGSSGSIDMEFMAIPRFAGEFTIPEAQFSYFDLKSKTYKTLKTPEYKLAVAEGEAGSSPVMSNYTSKENVKRIGEDIRFINVTDLQINKKNEFLYGSLAYWLWFLIPSLIFAALFVLYRKQIKENSNVALMRNKRASKQAVKRLKAAKEHLEKDSKAAFYEEVLKALWGYTGDKLNMPVSQLSKDNIEAELTKCSVSEGLVKEFVSLLDICEFARFAPSASSESMESVYDKAADVISRLDQEVKK